MSFLKTVRNLFFRSLVCFSVERVENLALFTANQQFLGQLLATNQQLFEQDKLKPEVYYHGTKGSNVDSIVFNGFDKRYIGKNGNVYGQGFYFGKTSMWPLDCIYSPLDGLLCKYVLRVEVAKGVCAEGNESMQKPPAGCHSTTDNALACEVLVTYDEHQQYVSHVITMDMTGLVYFIVQLTTCTTTEAHRMIVKHLEENNNYAYLTPHPSVIVEYQHIHSLHITTDDDAPMELTHFAFRLVGLVGDDVVYQRCSREVQWFLNRSRKRFSSEIWKTLWRHKSRTQSSQVILLD